MLCGTLSCARQHTWESSRAARCRRGRARRETTRESVVGLRICERNGRLLCCRPRREVFCSGPDPEAHLPTPAQFRELPSDFSAPEGRCATNGPHYAGFCAAFFFFAVHVR